MQQTQEKFKYLRKWTLAENYIGEHWFEYYVILGKHRDSDCLVRSNFAVLLQKLGGESQNKNIIVVRETHWAVGWCEWIGIHKSCVDKLNLAESLLEKLDDYPVLDEFHFSELENNEASKYWESLPIKYRLKDYIQPLREKGHKISVFQARKHFSELTDRLYDNVRESLN